MATEDLREHDHSRQGSGGYIDFGQEINDDPNVTQIESDNVEGGGGSLTEVDTGSLTVAANGFEDAVVTGASRDSNLLLTAYPDADYAGARFILHGAGSGSPAAVFLEWDISASAWKVSVNETSGNEITVTWTVYEAA